jgi:ABC-type antimicrobial peptide transport system permease subunit
MIKHILKTTFRRLAGNYKMTILTLLGLALGIASAFVIFTKVRYERSFDSFHTGSKDIYRVVRLTSGLQYLNGALEYRAGIHFPVPGEIKKTIPEVNAVTSILYIYGNKIWVPAGNSQKPKSFRLKDGIAFADPQFFEVFDYANQPITWFSGNKNKALKDIFSVVITRNMEELLFKGKSAMGQVINIGGQDYTVKGVISNFPVNSDFPFKILISMSTFTESFAKGVTSNWGGLSDNFQCFVKVKNGAGIELINQKLNRILKENLPPSEVPTRSMKLQPLNEVHRDGRFGNFNNHTVSGFILNALLLLAIFILIIVGLNFSNGLIAQAIKNTKDTSVRRIVGCGKLEIFNGFFLEALVLTISASVIGLFMAYIVFDTQSDLVGVPKEYYMHFGYNTIITIVLIILAVSFIASIFPGIFFTSKSALSTLKQNEKSVLGNKNNVNKVTIAVQFAVVTVLTVSTIIILKQLNYIHKKDLGYDPENIISSGIPESSSAQISALKAKLSKCTEVESVSFCSGNPAKAHNWISVSLKYNGEPVQFDSELKSVDTSYFNLNSFKLLAGRIYSNIGNINSIIVNSEFVKEAGIKNPSELVGTEVNGVFRNSAVIAGIVNDSYSSSLHQKLRPCVFINNKEMFQEIEIKLIPVAKKSLKAGQLAQITSIWNDIYPEDDNEFSYLTEQISNYYKAENNLFRILLLFTFVTTFLCCLGVFGLSVFISEQRTKEIGVRKVNGAKTSQIMLMLNNGFIMWIVVSFLFACPIAGYAMNKWLQNFAYKTELSWWVFGVAGVATVAVAVLTVSWQSWRVATRNPVEALRYE